MKHRLRRMEGLEGVGEEADEVEVGVAADRQGVVEVGEVEG